jgi:hypothetical protein
VVKPARANGSTIRNTGEMRRMAIEEPQTSSVAMRVNSRGVVVVLAVVAEPVVQAASVELAAQVAQEALGALVGLAVQVAREALAASVELAVQADREVLAALVVLAAQVAQVGLAALVVQLAVLERRLEKGVLELLIVQVLELVIAQVVELETVPVAAPAKIKSVTAVRHRAQALEPKREADTAVVAAATTRAPAATEVARAWEAVVTAVVAAAE